jgi:hypothetical protein
MSIGSVQANFARLSVETTDTFQQMKRQAAEAKLYYLRDVHSPEEFDALVEEELYRAAANQCVKGLIKLFDLVRLILSE